jgi:hypothetical protein
MEPSLKRGSKIWSQLLRDLAPTVTALARPSSSCTDKLQSHPLVKVGDPQEETRKYPIVIKIWLRFPDGYLIRTQAGRLTVGSKIIST